MNKVNFSNFKPKEWKELRNQLTQRLEESGVKIMHSRIVRVESDKIAFEGGRIPVIYNATDKELYVWNKGTRWSGSHIALEELHTARIVIGNWLHDLQEEG